MDNSKERTDRKDIDQHRSRGCGVGNYLNGVLGNAHVLVVVRLNFVPVDSLHDNRGGKPVYESVRRMCEIKYDPALTSWLTRRIGPAFEGGCANTGVF